MFLLESDFKGNSLDSDALLTMSDTDKLSYMLDVVSMHIAQLNDDSCIDGYSQECQRC